MFLSWSSKKSIPVEVVNKSLDVGVIRKPFLVTVFEAKEIPPNSNALGPLDSLDLTGYSEYRLILHMTATPGTPFVLNELFGPAGEVDQVVFDVGGGEIAPSGVLNYRARFDIFGPKNFSIQLKNAGSEPLLVNGTLYAVA